MKGLCSLIKLVAGLGFLLAGLVCVGCGRSPSKVASGHAPANASPPLDPWVLVCNDPSRQEPALLWNGLIGIRLTRAGEGVPGKTFFMIDHYESSGEEKIIPLENPVQIDADEGSQELDSPEAMRNYIQRLDMRTGVLTSEWDVDISTDAHPKTTAHVKSEAVIHPKEKLFAERWSVTADRDASVAIGAAGDESIKMSGVSWNVVQKSGANPNGVSTNSKKGQSYVWSGVWSIGPGAQTGKQILPAAGTYEDIERASKAAWKERWKTDIEIDGPVADQQAVRSFLFYLRSAIQPGGKMSISPFGLSNATYNGHVFWDADIWVFPALALVDPVAAAEIPKYRLRLSPTAQLNAYGGVMPRDTFSSGTLPNLSAKVIPMMKFPWESSVSGKETVPGPSQKELHISGSVAWSLATAARLGLVAAADFREVATQVDNYYRHKLSVEGDGREIRDVMSPDENHVGDNDLYTNLLANWLQNRPWDPGHREQLWYKLPRDEKSFLSYDSDALRGYKQAAAVLSIYPLQYPPAEKQARVMMDRFADKVIKNGPAMTDSIHSIIWSRLGEKDRAYESWKASWEPFTQSPLLLFSEKRNRPTTYFNTGAAGSLQSVLYGFLGFRIDWKKEPGAAWTTQLRGDAWLSIKPNLPQAWKGVKFKNFTILGRRYTLLASPSAARVTSGE